MASDHLVKEENVLFNDTLNTFFKISGFMVLIIWLRKEMFYLTMHSTHFICGYMVQDNLVKDHSHNERKPVAFTSWAILSD